MVATVVAVAIDVLHGGINVHAVLLIGRKIIELHTSAVDAVLGLLGDVGLVRRTVEQIATTAEFLQMMVFKGQFGVSTRLEIRTETNCLVTQLGQLSKAVAVVIESTALAVLSKDVNTCLMVIGHQRSVHGRIVVEHRKAAHAHNGMSQLGRVAQRFFGNDVDGSRNGRCAKQCRTSSTHHLHSLYHVGRYLFQSVHSCQSTEHGARVYQNLRIRTVKAIDAYLLETTVLAVVLYPHTRLEVQSLCQCG